MTLESPEIHRRIVTIVNKRGLHARAAARFVKCAEAFDADIRVRRQDMEVDGRSIMGLMLFAAAQHSEVEIITSGPDAHAALNALADLIAARFGEEC